MALGRKRPRISSYIGCPATNSTWFAHTLSRRWNSFTSIQEPTHKFERSKSVKSGSLFRWSNFHRQYQDLADLVRWSFLKETLNWPTHHPYSPFQMEIEEAKLLLPKQSRCGGSNVASGAVYPNGKSRKMGFFACKSRQAFHLVHLGHM
ncbi:predicted protein [Histoplasma capsulatum G186AR]|uniref:Uncharacterized protein n=1 Tax=Ajellomyces capsulatus (strain G186AR / H82 / ATCC MYA-2454 / RMSCC 2432) TaxID=447093 RepID=C0NAT5_AJECG|nr:uncharacterized protein HCBG_00231 [Histoplasma capsulatum G186AR]EEH10776.1 predicted protein [Histoplasma capsulatum G186AR]